MDLEKIISKNEKGRYDFNQMQGNISRHEDILEGLSVTHFSINIKYIRINQIDEIIGLLNNLKTTPMKDEENKILDILRSFRIKEDTKS